MVKENIKAPNIRLPATDNAEYSLKKSIGNYVIIYFYPKNDTPGCTLETNDFNKFLPSFRKLNCEVYGISKDNLKSHIKFKKKYKIKFDLLSDVNLKVIKKYGVWGMKSFLGKKYKGVVRSTFLINSNGKIHKIWSNVRVKDHAKSVLEEIKNI